MSMDAERMGGIGFGDLVRNRDRGMGEGGVLVGREWEEKRWWGG